MCVLFHRIYLCLSVIEFFRSMEKSYTKVTKQQKKLIYHYLLKYGTKNKENKKKCPSQTIRLVPRVWCRGNVNFEEFITEEGLESLKHFSFPSFLL